MTNEQIIEAVRNATKGTFRPEKGISTLMGWTQEYDAQGRPLRANPNTITGTVRIDGKDYKVVTRSWQSRIYNTENGELIGEIDFMPEYVKEYWEKRK